MDGFNLGALLAGVPSLDTNRREQIQYIDLEALDADKNNFYSVAGIEKLSSNIELFGLQQPIRVRVNPDKAGRYIVVSGHRRRAALKLLVKDGKTKYMRVPCIIETETGSPELEELRLIMANSDSRQLTSAELAAQAERVEDLLYKLKEQGVKFPGRMRDHVAEACKVSKSKLARLKVIDKNLIGELRDAWISGHLNETCAYRLAQEDVKQQQRFDNLTAAELQNLTLKKIDDVLDDEPVEVNEEKTTLQKDIAGKAYNAEAAAAAAVRAREKEDEKFFGLLRETCNKRYFNALRGSRSRREGIDLLKEHIGKSYSGNYGGRVDTEADPYGLELKAGGKTEPFISRTWTEVYDMLSIIALDYVNAALDQRDEAILDSAGAKEPLPSKPKWRTRKPSKSGTYAAKFDAYGVTLTDIAYYDTAADKWYYSDTRRNAHEEPCIGWYPLPEDEYA